MQRSISHKNYIDSFIYLSIFIIYESISDIYLFLPPLFAILLILFLYNLKNNDTINLLFISIALFFFEAQKGYIAFTSIIYAILLYKFIIIKLDLIIKCKNCKIVIIVLFSYPGYYLFSLVLSQMFILPNPQINLYVIYYIIIESIIAILFMKWA